MRALRETMRPDGFNVGANIGEAAGAGVKDHFHLHVVPRWNGDNNFMAVIGDVKLIPQMLAETLRSACRGHRGGAESERGSASDEREVVGGHRARMPHRRRTDHVPS